MSILLPEWILAGTVIPDFKSKAWDILCTHSRCQRECCLGRSQASVCQSPSSKHVVWVFRQIRIQGAEEIKPPAFCAVLRSVVSNSLWPFELWPASLLCLRDFSGRNTGAGCHSLLLEIFPTRDWICISWVSPIAGRFFTGWAMGGSPNFRICCKYAKPFRSKL